ncbi:DUF5367 family protein [Chamaesiphon sp. GL140_3_metabinner_50]|uniref:DUF5367 family protein n=1 Tax=Chamaesiphon sp. GL140_3_metabinner_50 TaxID=2970812 RepID=UPI0025DAB912|nr:DUF5367 family protein [Chamaesiphon sp. GL140_3_metabinner_50]
MTQVTLSQTPFNPISFVILGAIFWFEALLCIRLGGETLFVEGNPWLLLLFVASIPVAGVLVKVSAVIGKVNRSNLFSAVAIMALTATLLDGVALTWFQGWYSLTQPGLLLAAGWLLWGVGVSLGVGYWASRPRPEDCE